MLTEAALASKTDHLIGLKENVILGHLIPAGTGFRTYQAAQWRDHLDAMIAQSKQETTSAPRNWTLLDTMPDSATAPSIYTQQGSNPFYNEAATDFLDNEMGDDYD